VNEEGESEIVNNSRVKKLIIEGVRGTRRKQIVRFMLRPPFSRTEHGNRFSKKSMSCFELIRYGNETILMYVYKYMKISYIINIACFLHVSVILLAILR